MKPLVWRCSRCGAETNVKPHRCVRCGGRSFRQWWGRAATRSPIPVEDLTASPLPRLFTRIAVIRADGTTATLWDRRGARA